MGLYIIERNIIKKIKDKHYDNKFPIVLLFYDTKQLTTTSLISVLAVKAWKISLQHIQFLNKV